MMILLLTLERRIALLFVGKPSAIISGFDMLSINDGKCMIIVIYSRLYGSVIGDDCILGNFRRVLRGKWVV